MEWQENRGKKGTWTWRERRNRREGRREVTRGREEVSLRRDTKDFTSYMKILKRKDVTTVLT